MRGDGPDPSEAAARFGLATAARDVAISVGIMLGLLYLFPILGLAASGPRWPGEPHRALMTAGLNLQARTGLGGFLASPLAGLGLVTAWAAAALLVGGLLLRFRDA